MLIIMFVRQRPISVEHCMFLFGLISIDDTLVKGKMNEVTVFVNVDPRYLRFWIWRCIYELNIVGVIMMLAIYKEILLCICRNN